MVLGKRMGALLFSAILSASLMSAGLAIAGDWRDGRPMEGARTQIKAVAVNGEVYVAGGSSIMGPRDEFEVYDPVGDHWRAMPALPKGREMFGIAALGNIIYVAGGVTGTEGLRPSDEVWAFDTGTAQWRRAPALPNSRVGVALAAAGGAVYAIGGTGAASDKILRLDGGEWISAATLSPKRTGHAVATMGNKIYVIGGQTADGTVLSRVDILDVSTKSWSRGPSLPRAATALTANFVDDKLHVAGGMVPSKRLTLADHHSLRVGSGQWAKEKALPTPRQGLASAAVGAEWFVIGGGSGSGAYTVFTASDVVEVFRP